MKWEYKVLSLPRLDGEKEEKLNSLGDEGWELVSVSPLSNFVAFLKRAK
jgi:hypothetical protein